MPNADQIIELLHEARLRPAGPERERFLVEACSSDAELREQIVTLLEAVDDGSFLKAPAFLQRAHWPIEKPGDRIGRYKLLQQIGEGGCGVVYMAEQEEPVRRRVALKVIKLGMDTKSVIARFEAERQALALMDHPNIAKVFDAGATDTGRPYFVMELVRGIKITDYCDRNQLSAKERLELFIQVCHAIQHAHQKGIIHRDIKPSNILVTVSEPGSAGCPKVIDFGIAKATNDQRLTDKTVFTAFEQFIGTPAYMSPEQAMMTSLDIDTRTDIYALGVLLYELLTGQTPFDAKELMASGLDVMRRIICEQEPARPSTRLSTLLAADLTTVAKHRQSEPARLGTLIRGDLDWIVMKALEKERSRRYETASSLAADIHRHLSDEPVVARPPSAGYKLKKYARRYKGAFAATTSMVVLLLVGIAATSWQAVRATGEAKRANQAEQLATKRMVESEEAKKEALAVSEFLTGMFESTRPGKDAGGREAKVADVLDRAAEKLKQQLADHPERRFKLQATLGTTYARLGLHLEAIPLLEEAQDYYEHQPGAFQVDLLYLKRTLAVSYNSVNRLKDSIQMYEDIVRLSREYDTSYLGLGLEAMVGLHGLYARAGMQEERRQLLEQRKVALEEKLTRFRRELGAEHKFTLEAMIELSVAYSDAGRSQEALALRAESLTLRRKVFGPEHEGTLVGLWFYANACVAVGRNDEALTVREELLALRRKVNGPEHPLTIAALGALTGSYLHAGRTEEALIMHSQMLAACRKVFGPEHPETKRLSLLLTDALKKLKKTPVEVIAILEEALVISRKLNRPEDSLTPQLMNRLAELYETGDRKDEAQALRIEAASLEAKRIEQPTTTRTTTPRESEGSLQSKAASKPTSKPDPTHTLAELGRQALAHRAAGRFEEAIRTGEELLTRRRKELGPDHLDTLTAMHNLGISQRMAGRVDESIAMLEKGVELRRKVLRPDHPSTLATMRALADAYAEAGRPAEAERLLKEVTAIPGKAATPSTK